jgi:hypothetical protein
VTTPFHDRDGGEIEAFIVDRYLDDLLSRQGDDPGSIPAQLRATVERLATDLPRFHPSFRFEERLALRLAEAAAAMRLPLAAGAETAPVPIAARRPRPGPAPESASSGALGSAQRQAARPVVIGGVLTSAAISIAGAAFVAWRRSRPSSDPMGRAVRAIARGRIA